MSKTKKGPSERDLLLIDALVWNCPRYSRQGVSSCCLSLTGGSSSNCVKENCTRVSDIFRTMAQIKNKEIIVF